MIAAADTARRWAPPGADKAYDAAEHIAALGAIVSHRMWRSTRQGDDRQSMAARLGTRATRSASGPRKRIEEPFGWIKATDGLRKPRHRSLPRVGWVVTLTAAACNLIRLSKILASAL